MSVPVFVFGQSNTIADLPQVRGHHSLVLMLQQMTVENRHSPNNRIGKIHHQVGGSTVWNVYRVEPVRIQVGARHHDG